MAIMGGASSTTQEMSIAFVVIGAVMFLAGINVAVTVSQLILVQRIDDHLIWLKKINGARFWTNCRPGITDLLPGTRIRRRWLMPEFNPYATP